jgi:hypothetical protein
MNFNPGPKHTIVYPNYKPRYKTFAQSITLDSDYYEAFKEQALTALSKFSSSVKTRVVHDLITKNLVFLGTVHTDINYSPFSASIIKDKELKGVIVNFLRVDDTMHGSLADIITKIVTNLNLIKSEKKLISDLQVYKLEKLNKEKRELIEKFRDNIDWILLIDIIYQEYLHALGFLAIDKNSNERVKIFKTLEALLDAQFRKLLMKVDKSIFEDPISTGNYRLALQFFILTYYLQISKKEAILILSEAKGEWVKATLEQFLPEEDDEKYQSPKAEATPAEIEKYKEELVEKKAKIKQHYDNLKKELQKLKIEQFDAFANILNILEVANINKNTFVNLMREMVGEETLILNYQDVSKLAALFAGLNYRTNLYSKLFDIDKTLQKRMEELLLNQRRKIIIKEKKTSFLF